MRHGWWIFVVAPVLLASVGVWAQEPSSEIPSSDTPETLPTIDAHVAEMRSIGGLFPLYWDEGTGRLSMEIGRFETDVLYQVSLPAGLGSNPIGLDRGQLGGTHVVRFERVGRKVLMVEPNPRYRALSDDQAERRAVEDSFARSVHWGFTVVAEQDGHVLVDANEFFLRDAHGVAARLRRTEQGTYQLDPSRSAIYLPKTRGFERNTEVEATLTFTSNGGPGALVRQIAPTPQALTVRQHHSFVELPPLKGDDAYRPRQLDPRVGMFTVVQYDFASGIGEPLERRLITRHRLVKADPRAEVSKPVEPIVYYVDPGAPEPVRSALIEGASWWNEAFEAAGFVDAFRVEVLPEDADPMDLEVNMVHWVHRSTRGWSYGGSVVDPRTGEILKGNVILGSLRVRQDVLLGRGLVGIETAAGVPMGADVPSLNHRNDCQMAASPSASHLSVFDSTTDPEAMALARIRQLSAHEVGHTLGLAHNFAASTYGRASVMDYPAPLVNIDDKGDLDLSDAYDSGIGAYDRFAVNYAYRDFGDIDDESERASLLAIVDQGLAEGMLFVSDSDARPAGAAHPLANLWDNGNDPVAMLRHEMRVRRIGLNRFGLDNLPDGLPVSQLEAIFLPLYLHHRYQLTAALKTLGGVEYSYAVKTKGRSRPIPVVAIVSPERQREALEAILETLQPEELVIPEEILALLPPPAFGYADGTAERFSGQTGPAFDAFGPARIVADIVLVGLLQPQRAARLQEQHARNPNALGFGTVLKRLSDEFATDLGREGDSLSVIRIRQIIRQRLIEHLITLASNPNANESVRVEAEAHLIDLASLLVADPSSRVLARRIQRFLDRDAPTAQPPASPSIPPGDPIGQR